jgi:hypothetical protein
MASSEQAPNAQILIPNEWGIEISRSHIIDSERNRRIKLYDTNVAERPDGEIWPGAASRNLAEALSEKKNARLAAQFMLRTGRLAYLEGDTQPTQRPGLETAAAPADESSPGDS